MEQNEGLRKLIKNIIRECLNESVQSNSGVDFVFNQNPMLSEIGTKEDYKNYINSIFPNSKNKDIWYHGTNANPNEIKSLNPSKDGTYGFGVYLLNKEGKYHTGIFGSNTLTVIVDVKKIYDFDKYGNDLIDEITKKYGDTITSSQTMVILQNTIRQEGYDSMMVSIGSDKYLILIGNEKFTSEMNHVLGSSKDIEGFKKYMNKNNEFELIKTPYI